MGQVQRIRGDEDGGQQPEQLEEQPHSVAAEEAVLGAVLLDNAAADKAFELIEPADFFRPHHRKIAEAMAAMREVGQPIDLVTLSDTLRDRGDLAEVGGAAMLGEIEERVPTAANVATYAHTVRLLSYRRKLIAQASSLVTELRSKGDPVCDYAPERLSDLIDLAVDADGRRETMQQALVRAVVEIEETVEGKREPAIPTGLSDLDRVIDGIKPGHLYVIGALSSHGKTSLATQLVEHPLENGVGVGIISPDTNRQELIDRIVGQRTGLSTRDIKAGMISGGDMSQVHEAADVLTRQPLEIVDELYDWPRVKAVIRRMVTGGAKIIVVDHLTLLRNPTARGGDDWGLAITRDLQQIARGGVAVLLLVQISVKSEGRSKKNWRPAAWMLKGTGASFENANEVLLGYWHGKDNPEKNIADGCEPYEIRVAKQKIGDTPLVKLRWDPRSMRFFDWFDAETEFVDDEPELSGGEK